MTRTIQPKRRRRTHSLLGEDPLWYKDAVIYQVHVRTFQDSDDDGIGDFPGLTSRLDYLQDLGVTAIWLLPFYPSPLKDEGYDIADYRAVNPMYGDLRQFRRLLREAHRRGLRVVTELVINHTSDQHPWFQRARRAKPGSRFRNYYVWSDTAHRYRDARIIFQDFETSNWTWDPVAGAYYWHRFYHHQPDLNFESADVRRGVLRALDFWLAMGVDGVRLDAIPYLFEREGTNCENLPETHAFLKELRRHVDERFDDKMLLAEANQWPEDAVEYFGDGDECHMNFHFPVMPRLFMAVRMEDRFPIIDILEQTPEIPEGCQWAIFLRNHDELTLEMVTDEDRDYMYRVYAAEPRARINLGIRRRLAPLLGNDRRRIELMNALLMSLPGTPIVYYGDEIGMGDNFFLGDRNGVRTPMQWSPDRNAGFSGANPHRLYLPVIIDPEYHYEAINAETQHSSPHSLLWWMRRLIALRKRYRAFGRGSIRFLQPDNHKVLAFVRRWEGERLLVVANLSRFVQHVELDLSDFEGIGPVELFGHTPFPRIGELPYLLTLGPHGFYWFSLAEEPVERDRAPEEEELRTAEAPLGALPRLPVRDHWGECVTGSARDELEAVLPEILAGRRWFGGKSRTVRRTSARAAAQVPGTGAYLVFVIVEYLEDEPETYVVPLAFRPGDDGERLVRERPWAALARIESTRSGASGVLCDAVVDPGFNATLLDLVERRRSFAADGGSVSAWRARGFREVRGPRGEELPARVLAAEQSNTSLLYGDRLVLKLIRKLEPGENPDLEIGRFLTERTDFAHVPPVAGALEYTSGDKRSHTLGILQGYVENEGDAWRYTLDFLSRFFERALSRGEEVPAGTVTRPDGTPLHPLEVALAGRSMSEEEALVDAASRWQENLTVQEVVGLYPTQAALLGHRTAELHLALSGALSALAGARRGAAGEVAFAPEPFSELYQRSLYQSMRAATGKAFRQLQRRLRHLPAELRPEAEELLGRREDLLRRFGELLESKIDALRIRCHGDYHLGQVLWTGKDFVILDFEGEPARPVTERRIKRSPLRDVAGMLRSFDYAVHGALRELVSRGVVADQAAELEGWGRLWYLESAAAFLRAYLDTAGEARIVPADEEHLRLVLDVYLMDKAVYELRYELDNRPAWVHIPVRGILGLIENA
ncbi:MAG: maltose alpha-D-glucosyltransferase [Thermoanaerobaculia bacterium]